ncbi:uncharacterized protein LOC143235965 [Tachypleus tridentatus]|uniref:uncharacterized protein LOC143235965 n=1 Tax=Tachypleus tridentatus TaxID=6853 RepID=UPI003FD52F9E
MSDTPFYRMKPCRRSFSSSQLSLFGKECKAVRTVLLVVLSFIACWGPYFTVLFLNSYITQDTWMPAYFPLVVIFLSSSSCFIDPYIYVFRNETLQKHIKKLFHSHTPKRFGNRKMGTVVGINHLRSTTNIDQQDKTRRHRSYGATFNNQKDTYLHRSPTRKHHVPRRGPRSNVKLSHRSLAEYSKSPSSYTEVPLNVTRKASVFYLYNIHLHALRWKV